jgi:RNA polymerase sigma factor (sigma-70 family)
MPPPLDLDHASDAELFAFVARGEGPARQAQQALYQRHVRYLFGVLQKQRTRLLRLAGLSVEDLVHDTFARAFDRASTFREEPDLDPERARRRTRAWLGRVAQNLTADAFRRFREVSASPYLERAVAPDPAPDADEAPPSSRPELEPVRQAFAALSDREQDVLRVTALYHKAEGRDRLPNDVSAELARRWGISNDNVRAIRSRAMKKLQRALEAPELREQTP